MPQLDISTFASQIFWLAIMFGVLYWVLSNTLLPRVGEVIAARAERIQGDLARAQQMKKETDELIAAYEAKLTEARQKASTMERSVEAESAKTAADRQARQAAELAEQIKTAEQRIAAARTQAMGNLRDVAGEVARAAAERLVGRAIAPEAARAAVDSAVAARGGQ